MSDDPPVTPECTCPLPPSTGFDRTCVYHGDNGTNVIAVPVDMGRPKPPRRLCEDFVAMDDDPWASTYCKLPCGHDGDHSAHYPKGDALSSFERLEGTVDILVAALALARDELHRACLERGSTDGYQATFAVINEALGGKG